MRLQCEKIAKSMNGNHSPRSGLLIRAGSPQEDIKAFPGTSAQLAQEFPVIQKIAPNDFWERENDVSMWNLCQNLSAKKLAKFHHPLLMA